MLTLSATAARSDFFELIKNVLKKHQSLRINHREGDIVMMSEEDYDSLLETIELLSAPSFKKKFRQSRKEIKQGKTVFFNDIFKD